LRDTDEAALTAAQRAEAGRKAAELIKSQPPTKASEALGQLMEKGVKRTTTTQADRTRVGGGNIGGAPFSAISQADPNYAGKVWGVMDEGTAARLKNLTTDDTAWTTMLGSANQLKTNPIVFEKLKRGFIDSMKQGNLSKELASKINHNLELTFGAGADIRDPKIWRQADTFEKRAALADVMMGQGIAPSKGGLALGGEKSGKGVIFKPTDILKRETEPSLLHTEHGGDVPTFAAGPRLFRIDKESEYRPDLHPGFPTLLKGEDYGINMIPTPTEVYLPDWHKKFKKDNPERYPPFKTEKQAGPGYYDLALGVKGEGLPSQELNDEYIRHLLREGFKDGGEVDLDAADSRLSKAIQERMSGGMAKGGEVDIDAADARLQAAINARMGMAEGGGAFKKLEFMADGGIPHMADAGKVIKGVAKIGKKLFANDDVLPAAEREANKTKFLSESKDPRMMYHGTRHNKPGWTKRPTGEGIREFDVGSRGMTFVSPQSNFANTYGTDYAGDHFKSGAVYPVHVQARNPFDYQNADHIDLMTEKLSKLSGSSPSVPAWIHAGPEFIRKRLNSGAWDAIEDPLTVKAAKNLGFDSMYMNEDGVKNLGVFDPKRIKSAVGNRGTYDINEPDITKAEGGLLHMADAGRVVKGLGKLGKRLFADEAPKVTAPAVPRTLSAGDIVNGMMVRKDIPNTSSIGASLTDYSTHGLQEVPMSAFDVVGKPRYRNAQEEKRTKELARQIQQNKELNPLIVVKDAEGHYILEGGHRFDALRELDINSFPALMVHDLESLADIAVPAVKKAEGGGAFKKLQFMGGGGITTSGGSFSPEELGVDPAELSTPFISDKRLRQIKRNAADLVDEGKGQLEKEYQQLGKKGGKKDFAIRVGSQILGGGADLVNLGLEGVDLIQGAIPALSRPESVMDVGGSRIPKFRLASDEPVLGSQHFIRKFKDAKLLGDNEFPLTELAAGFVAPAAAANALRKSRQAYKTAKEIINTPKKRQGGLTAMAR
jgi:hypothetical protein